MEKIFRSEYFDSHSSRWESQFGLSCRLGQIIRLSGLILAIPDSIDSSVDSISDFIGDVRNQTEDTLLREGTFSQGWGELWVSSELLMSFVVFPSEGWMLFSVWHRCSWTHITDSSRPPLSCVRCPMNCPPCCRAVRRFRILVRG